jgi:hypothetical protein
MYYTKHYTAASFHISYQKMTLIQPPYVQQVSLQNFLNVVPFESFSHNITLQVSNDIVFVRHLELLHDGNCSASVFVARIFLNVFPSRR